MRDSGAVLFAKLGVAAVLVLTLVSCSRFNFFSRAGSESFFTTRFCGVDLDGRSGHGRLRLTLNVTKALPPRALVETEFQNPSERTMLSTQRTVVGSERELVMLSPPFTDIRTRSYETVTRVYADAERKRVLGIHTHVCASLVDSRDLNATPVRR